MGQVGGQMWVDGDGFVAAGLMQIGDGSLRKKEGSMWVYRGRKKRWRGNEKREMEKGE